MRRFVLSLAAASAALALAATASATAPIQQTFQRQGTQSFDCGSFQDVFTFTTTLHILTFSDQNGTAVEQVFHVHRVSTDTNSVTGKTLNSSADRNVTFDLIAGTTTVTGQNENTTYAGLGVVVQDVGRVVTDSAGNVVFEAGQHQGDYCSALA